MTGMDRGGDRLRIEIALEGESLHTPLCGPREVHQGQISSYSGGFSPLALVQIKVNIGDQLTLTGDVFDLAGDTTHRP